MRGDRYQVIIKYANGTRQQICDSPVGPEAEEAYAAAGQYGAKYKYMFKNGKQIKWYEYKSPPHDAHDSYVSSSPIKGVQIGNRIVWGIMDRGMGPSAALSQPGLSNLPGFMPVSRQPAVMQLLPPTPTTTTTTTTTTDYQPVTETTPVSHTTGAKMYSIKYVAKAGTTDTQLPGSVFYVTEAEAIGKFDNVCWSIDLKKHPNLTSIVLYEGSSADGKVIKSFKIVPDTTTTPTNWTTSTTDTTTTPAPKPKADNTWMWIVGGIAAAVGIGGIGYYMVKRKQ